MACNELPHQFHGFEHAAFAHLAAGLAAGPRPQHANATLAQEFPVKFYPGVSYRHLSVIPKSESASVEELAALKQKLANL